MEREVLPPCMHQGLKLLLVRSVVAVGIVAMALVLDGAMVWLSIPDPVAEVEAPAPLTGTGTMSNVPVYIESAP